ncbi:MAG: hypothetical protein ACTSU2_09745 [Promethearchaeota archaeon]
MDEIVSSEIRTSLMNELKIIEDSTDLKNMTILSRQGMKIASADSIEISVDPVFASSTALIELAITFNDKVEHGTMRELILRGEDGYAILMYIDENYMTFAGLKDMAKIGYYLEYLRIKCKRFLYILEGQKITEKVKNEVELINKVKKEDELKAEEIFEMDKTPDKDLDAMKDVLDFLNDWAGDEVPPEPGQVENGIVGIDDSFMINKSIEDDLAAEGEASSEPSSEGASKKQEIFENFEVYEDEIAPIPLENIGTDDLSSDEAILNEGESGSSNANNESEPGSTYQTSASYSTGNTKERLETPVEVPPDFNDEEPDFDKMIAEEYEDIEFDPSEEEAMLDALNDLGYTSNSDEKKKKKE